MIEALWGWPPPVFDPAGPYAESVTTLAWVLLGMGVAVTAIVVVKSGETLDEESVIKHCAGQMAHFKVPKRVIFVDSLPKNPSGKLLKRELRQRFVGGETLDKAIQKNFGT